jgi:hypothetical protein
MGPWEGAAADFVPKVMAYQGYVTDAANNPLGQTAAATYPMQFKIYTPRRQDFGFE